MSSLFVLFVLLLSYLPAWAAYRTVAKSFSNCNNAGDLLYCTIQDALNAAGANDTIYVLPVTPSGFYNESISISNPARIFGSSVFVTPTATWSAGTQGASSDAPVLRYTTTTDEVINIKSDNVIISGLEIDSSSVTANGGISFEPVGTNVDYVTITYCSFVLNDGDKAITVDNGKSVSNLTVDYCSFDGPEDELAYWFSVGEGTAATGDGGAADGVVLSNNEVIDAMSELQLDNTNNIKNIRYSHNTFDNAWNGLSDDYYGYIFIDSPAPFFTTGMIQGLTVTHNTFEDGSGASAADEFAFLIANPVTQSAAAGDWAANCALHFNNFLQTDDSGDFPIVGFETANIQTTEIAATQNWWGSAKSPKTFGALVSNLVSFLPRARTQIAGGGYAEIAASTTAQPITGTAILNNFMSLQVTTTSGGAATLIPTHYTSTPTGTSLPSGISALKYFNLGVKSGQGNIDSISVTFYSESGAQLNSANPLYWDNGSDWIPVPAFAITTTAAKTIYSPSVSETYVTHAFGPAVIANITRTGSGFYYITPTAIHSSPTQTFFMLAESSTSSSSTTTSVPADDDDDDDDTTTTSSKKTTTSTTSAPATTTTSTPNTTTSTPPQTTTTSVAQNPRLTLSPSMLDFTDNGTAQSIIISNTGTGTLAWSIPDNETVYNEEDNGSGWIFSVSPDAGSLTTDSDNVTVIVSRSGLPVGSYSADMLVMSNGGNLTVGVDMQVAGIERPTVRVAPNFLLFLNESKTDATLTIRNPTRTGTLTWEVQKPRYRRGGDMDWITVSPVSGFVQDQPGTVQVSIAKTNLPPGLYSATLPIATNVGNRNISVFMRVQLGESEFSELVIDDSFLLFSDPEVTEDSFIITNGNPEGLPLTWTVALPEYIGEEGWITSVGPLAGETTTEEDEVTVFVNRDVLTIPGIYRATITVSSNGGVQDVNVFLYVPFL